MPRTVTLAAVLPRQPPRLYAMYLNAREHAAFTGAPVTIAGRAGTRTPRVRKRTERRLK